MAIFGLDMAFRASDRTAPTIRDVRGSEPVVVAADGEDVDRVIVEAVDQAVPGGGVPRGSILTFCGHDSRSATVPLQPIATASSRPPQSPRFGNQPSYRGDLCLHAPPLTQYHRETVERGGSLTSLPCQGEGTTRSQV